MNKWFDRIQRQFGYYPGSSPIPPKPRHALIPLPELRQRITDQVGVALKSRGFERPSHKFETWVRRRTPYIYDLTGAHFIKSEPSIGMVQVGVSASLHLSVVEKIYHRFAGGIYRVQSGTAGKMLYLVYEKEKLPTVWYFWANAYSEDTTQMVVNQIVSYGLPLLEKVTDYESLLVHPFGSSICFSKKAILLALIDRIDEAQQLLISAIEEDDKVRAAYKGSGPPEIHSEWQVHIDIFDALRTNRFNELVKDVAANVESSNKKPPVTP
jgi:hypothetical protein